MKRILVVCGSGYATAYAVRNRLHKLLENRHLTEGYEIICTDMKSFDNCMFEADVIIQMNYKQRAKYEGISTFNGVPFLTGVGMEELMEEIIACLEKESAGV